MFQSRTLRRCLGSSSQVTPRPRPRHPSILNLDKPLQGLEPPIYAPTKDQKEVFYKTELTTLPNGLRVASQPRFGKYTTIGVAVGSGSRFETGFQNGLSHFLEKMGFNASKRFENKDSILKVLEEFGGLCDSQTSRDTTVYAVSAEGRGMEKVINLLSSTVLQPVLSQAEIEEARQSIQFEKEDMELRPEQEISLIEMLHKVSWGDSNLGLSRYCPEQNIELITRDHILKFLRTYFIPSRMVISGVGVEHQELVDLVKHYFDFSQSTWNTELLGDSLVGEVDTSVANYEGGMIRIEKDFGAFNAGPLPVPELAHLAFGFESVPHNHPDFITACVLNILMGGGGSFSAGGPGKGMYSRLYTNVLNQLHWVYNATAYNSSYVDSGVFCVYASSPPNHFRNLISVITRELAGMAGRISDPELERSKTQLQSMLLMNLESRPIVFEDIGRQILANGCYKSPEEYISEIVNVTEEDVARLVKRLLTSKPSIAALGNLQQLPSFEEITGELNDKLQGASRNSRFNLFKS